MVIIGLSVWADDIPLLRWAGPPGSRPGTYEEWIAEHPYTPFSWKLDRVWYGDGRAGNVAILTEQAIAGPLAPEINQLSNNLQSEGYTVFTYQISGGTPETLKTFLQNLYNTQNIEGALFIGNLPVAWFEIKNDYNQYGYTDFPIDLFYMDLDGNWLDTLNTGNGKYDGHTGATKPEIYIGRLTPQGLGDDTLLLKNYFRKDNAYRKDTLLLDQRALVFVDDDWYDWAQEWAADVALLYPDTMNFFDPETTRATFYRTRLDTVQAWVSVFAHSWPGGHQFKYSNGNLWDYYYAYEYTNQDPPTNFYNFFACSFCRFTENNNCGGNRAIFNQTSGIGAIGSTKTGSMLNFDYFYRKLAEGKTLGEGFKYWFECIYDSIGMGFINLCWHYGMTLLADPWLKPLGHNTAIATATRSGPKSSRIELLKNPVSQKIDIRLTITQAQPVELRIYDCRGALINVIRTEMDSGIHRLSVPCVTDGLQPLPSGVYILQLRLRQGIFTKKVVKM